MMWTLSRVSLTTFHFSTQIRFTFAKAKEQFRKLILTDLFGRVCISEISVVSQEEC